MLHVKWYDNKVVNTISTSAKTHPVTTMTRFDYKTKKHIELSCCDIVKHNNKSMGGVDLADQLISLYRSPIQSKKYYMRPVFHMIDMVAVNSWLLYKCNASNLNLPKKEILPLAFFKLLIAFDLMKTGKICNPKNRRPFTITGSHKATKRADPCP